MDGYRDFTFDPQKFASLPSLVEDLHKHGQHYVMILVVVSLTLRAVIGPELGLVAARQGPGAAHGPLQCLGGVSRLQDWGFLSAAVICHWKSPVRAGSAEIRARLLH